MSYEIIDQLRNGEEVTVIGTEGDWYKVIVPEKTGYVHSNYLELLEKAEENSEIDSAMLMLIMNMMFQSMNTGGTENTDESLAFTPPGNLSLIDDFLQIEIPGTEDTEQVEKQFITVQSKSGNTFYIVIDRNGETENVYFLNLVDEADLIIAVLYWFFGTELGCAVRATGANSNMSRAQGINTDTMKLVGLVLSNGLVGLSGALYTQYLGSVTVNMGRGAIVIGLAAVIIGEVLFSKLFRNFALRLAGVVLGAIVYYIVIALVIQLGLNTDDLKLFSATFVAVALFIPHWKSNHASKTLQKGGKGHA